LNLRTVHIKFIFIFFLIVWICGILSPAFLPPYFTKLFPGFFLDKLYSLVCHQDPAKSFFIFGNKLEVCARCSGIYAGGFIFSLVPLFLPRFRPQRRVWLFLSMIPMAADVLLYSSGFYLYSKWIAFATGLILGSVSILYIFAGIEDYFIELKLSSNVQ
jgi:uncharacterized membrane protein